MAGDQTLKVLLQLKADSAAATDQLNGAMREIKASGDSAGKGIGEAIGKSLSSGKVDADSLARSIGEIAPQFALAAAAAFGVYKAIASAYDQQINLNKMILESNVSLDKYVDIWIAAAKASEDYGDLANFGTKLQAGLDDMAKRMKLFREQQGAWWQDFWDNLVTMPGGFKLSGTFGEARAAEALKQEKKAIGDAVDAAKEGDAAVKQWKEDLAAPAEGLKRLSDEAVGLKLRLNAIHLDAVTGMELPKAKETLAERTKITAEIARNESQQQKLTRELEKGNHHHKAAVQHSRELTTTLRDQANLLADIRGKQQAIAQNPFLSADQKNAALIPLIIAEMRALGAQIQKDADEQKRLTDPAQWTQMQGKIQQAQRDYAKLGMELKKAAFGGSIRAELTAWVNQFGATSKQVAGIITSTLNTAIASTSQALTNLIFQTGNWKQAFADAAKSIVQNIIQIALQWVVSQTLMKVLSKIFSSEQVTTSSTAGSQTAAAWAPAATAASIATEGEADIAGVIALTAAMAAGKGIVTGVSAFQSGGYTGFGQDSQFAGFVHKNEYVMPASTVSAYGIDFMNSIRSNVSRPGYASGGFVGSQPSGGSRSRGASMTPQVHIAVFDDPKKLGKWLEGRDGQRIIYDSVSRQRVELGIA